MCHLQVDRVFRMHVAGYDLLMGIYLIALVTAAMVLKTLGEVGLRRGD